MVGKTGICLLVLLLATAGCSLLGGGGLKPGDTAEGDLGAGVEIEELIPDPRMFSLRRDSLLRTTGPPSSFPWRSPTRAFRCWLRKTAWTR